MDAALAVVAVQRAVVLVLPGELAQPAQVLTEPLRRDGGILPTFVRVGLARDKSGCSEPRLPHLPALLLLLRIVEELDPLGRVRALLLLSDEIVRLALCLLLVGAAELDHEPAASFGHQLDVLWVKANRFHVLD